MSLVCDVIASGAPASSVRQICWLAHKVSSPHSFILPTAKRMSDSASWTSFVDRRVSAAWPFLFCFVIVRSDNAQPVSQLTSSKFVHLLNNPNCPVCMGMVHVTLVLIYCFRDELMGLIACITVIQSKDSQKIVRIYRSTWSTAAWFAGQIKCIDLRCIAGLRRASAAWPSLLWL